jgi:hypothetical protein
MAFAFVNKGTLDQHNTSSTGIQGGTCAAIVAGNLLLIHAAIRNNAFTLNTPVTNWTVVSPQINDTYNCLLARIADGTANDNFPLLNWSGTAQAFGQMAQFSGNQASLTNIVHASVDESASGAGASGNDIQYNALSISAANTLVIARGMHNKTSTGNGVSVDALAGFTQIDQSNNNGSIFSVYWGYQIQTVATNLNSVIQTRSGATAESLQQSSLFISFKPATVASVANKAFLMIQKSINNG